MSGVEGKRGCVLRRTVERDSFLGGAAAGVCWVIRSCTGSPGETLEPRALPMRERLHSYAGDDF